MGQPVTHWQIIAKQPDKAAAFYASLFGWSVDATNQMGYRTVSTNADRGVVGGIWPAAPEANAMVTLYIEVDDVAAQVRKATELGGKVVMPPQKLPDGDELAVILDPEGLPFGLMRRAKQARGRAR